jgi:putative membrane protein
MYPDSACWKGLGAGAEFEYTDYLIIKLNDMKTVLFSSIVALSLGLFGCGGGGETHQDTVDSAKAVNKEVKPVQPDASNFAVNAANGGMMEVELGKIAQ